jgi:hypothetical protein
MNHSSQTKPRLVYFCDPPEGCPVHAVHAYHVTFLKCLRHFFDTVVISEDAEYAECVDKYRPDASLFGGGVENFSGKRPTFSNTKAFPEIPKLGYLQTDNHSPSRTAALSRFEQWGVEVVFALDTAMADHFPWPADRFFCIPWFIDTEVFRDHGEAKIIPVGMFGAGFYPANARYPWRGKTGSKVLQRFPSFVSQRPVEGTLHDIVGDTYARMLNRTRIALGCGGLEKRLARKHFEIPASRCALVTEETEVLRKAGFVDGENCIFTDESHVAGRLGDLLNDEVRLETIAQNGYALVHARHGYASRAQLAQWLRLHNAKKPGEQIVQPDLFGDLRLAPVGSTLTPLGRHEDPIDELVARAGQSLHTGRIKTAEELYSQALRIYPYLAESLLGLAVCALSRGQTQDAKALLERNFSFTTRQGALRQDPVEYGYYLLALRQAGDCEGLRRVASECGHLRHPFLNAARSLLLESVPGLGGPGGGQADTRVATACDSIHSVAARTPGEWMRYLKGLVGATGIQRVFRSACRRIAEPVRSWLGRTT